MKGIEALLLKTSHLLLRPFEEWMGRLIINHPLEFFKQLDLQRTNEWPHSGLKALMPLYLEELHHNKSHLGFGPWAIFDRNHSYVIGDAGFKGAPSEEGALEIGYSIVPEERGKGYATEAVSALCQWAFELNNVTEVRAECDRDNIPSQRVLEHNQFSFHDADQDIFIYKRQIREART